jgi:hypothetical protein
MRLGRENDVYWRAECSRFQAVADSLLCAPLNTPADAVSMHRLWCTLCLRRLDFSALKTRRQYKKEYFFFHFSHVVNPILEERLDESLPTCGVGSVLRSDWV